MKLFPPLFPTADPLFENTLRSDPVERFRFEQQTRLDPFRRHELAPSVYNFRGEDRWTEACRMLDFKARQDSCLSSSYFGNSGYRYNPVSITERTTSFFSQQPKPTVNCDHCGGTGKRHALAGAFSRTVVKTSSDCRNCSGTGKVVENE